jgi:hypothetical protein
MRPGFRSCYNRGLANDPSITGKIVVLIKIDGSGNVVTTTKIGGTGLPPEVEQCILDRAGKATFDAPGGSGSAIQVPVTFQQAP